jgi:hypothetical protein
MNLPTKDKEGKPYISYSQVSTFIKSPKEYIQKYFFKEPISFTAYLDFGSKVGEALEKNDFSAFEKDEEITLKKVIRLDEFEREVKYDFGEFYTIGYIDTNTKDLSYIIDYKTGSMDKESEYKKEEYIQPLIYAMSIEQETGKLPEKAEVVLIERYGNAFKGEILTVGQNIKHIPISITKDRIENTKQLILSTVKQIEQYYNVFLKLNTL